MRNTKEQLIKAGADLFHTRSFQGTGLTEILKAAGIPKGSFYHFFSDKEAFGLAVLEYHKENLAAFHAATLRNEELSPLRRVEKFLELAAQSLEDSAFTRGCPFGSMAQEMAGLSEPMRRLLEDVFADIRAAIARCIAEGQNAGEIRKALPPEETACFLLSALEGALLQGKTARSSLPVRNMTRLVTAQLLPPQNSL